MYVFTIRCQTACMIDMIGSLTLMLNVGIEIDFSPFFCWDM